ncbi:MAG: carboxypeptidase regulatory-like domain-containing protein [Candidatus Bathyarchaeota archaeon]|nr:MAG: carboxypeptidase regulatory-like domain-containing protein [Candidatus Bathyarchaeota archaeon]
MSTEKPISRPVAMSRISGHIYFADGAMIKSAKVSCDGIETRTLADGSFVLDDLTTGTHEVTVSLQGFKSTSKTVSIQEGEKLTLDFHLSKDTGTAKIHGHVYDATSKKPVEQGGTIIFILPVANKYKPIDKNGYYEFEKLPAGTYKLLTSIAGYEDHKVILTVTDDEIKAHDFFCKTQKIEEPPWG